MEGVQQEGRVLGKRRTKQNTKKENAKCVGMASCGVWMRVTDVAKR
jgi:hypothetical protein